jgi:hypothetical protein
VLTVSLASDPAHTGTENNLEITICRGKCKYSESVTSTGSSRTCVNGIVGAEETLKIEVTMGNNPAAGLKLVPRMVSGDGEYAAYFIPSKAGAYTFHIFGTLGQETVDEKITSSATTFSEVSDILVYPPAISMTNNQATTKVVTAKRSDDTTNVAIIIAGISVVVSVVALVIAVSTLMRKPKIINEVISDKRI